MLQSEVFLEKFAFFMFCAVCLYFGDTWWMYEGWVDWWMSTVLFAMSNTSSVSPPHRAHIYMITTQFPTGIILSLSYSSNYIPFNRKWVEIAPRILLNLLFFLKIVCCCCCFTFIFITRSPFGFFLFQGHYRILRQHGNTKRKKSVFCFVSLILNDARSYHSRQ